MAGDNLGPFAAASAQAEEARRAARPLVTAARATASALGYRWAIGELVKDIGSGDTGTVRNYSTARIGAGTLTPTRVDTYLLELTDGRIVGRTTTELTDASDEDRISRGLEPLSE